MSARAYENEPVVIQRDVEAVMVPAGTAITLKMGLAGYITQALGGSFTLYIDGNLYRLAGGQADAIGKEVIQAPQLPPNATAEDVRELAWKQMRSCYDPEIPINIVDLGLVYDCSVTASEDGTRDVAVTITLTAPGCGMGEVLVADVKDKIALIPTVRNVDVNLSFDPPWSQSMMSEAARLQTGMTW
ncbi:MAG: putative Fe-S cluster assembly protein SufT [Steroidobacterales bacterium]